MAPPSFLLSPAKRTIRLGVMKPFQLLNDTALDPDIEHLGLEDVKHWDTLSEELVQLICAQTDSTSKVIAIQGKWGSGKTRLISLVEQKLGTIDLHKTVNYNPWAYPGVDHTKFFFDQLATATNSWGKASKYRELGEFFKRLSALSEIAGASIKLARTILVFLTILSSYLAVEFMPSTATKLPTLLLIFAVVALGSQELLNIIISVFKWRGKTPQSLSDLKKAINKKLVGNGDNAINIAVFIDDIDRLPPQDICALFQLVKNNADFKNTVFVLSYDGQVVQEVLKKQYSGLFEKFTEKIVQIEFPVPPFDRGSLDKYFNHQLRDTLEKCPPDSIEQYWSWERITNLHYLYFRKMYVTYRDIKRIINAFRTKLPLLIRDGIMEVNLTDLLALEFINVLHPEVFEFVRANKAVFVPVTDPHRMLGSKEDDEELRTRFDKFIETQNFDPQDKAVIDLLNELFPQLGFGPSEDSYNESLLSSRIQCPEVFDRYFYYGNYIGDVPNAVVQCAFNYLKLNNTQPKIFEQYYRTDTLRVALDALRHRIRPLVAENGYFTTISFFASVFNASDQLVESDHTRRDWPVRFLTHSILRDLLSKIDDKAARCNILASALERSNGMFGSTMAIGSFLHQIEKEEEKPPFLNSDDVYRLRDLMTTRSRKWLSTAECLNNIHFRTIVSVIKQWIPQKEIITSVTEIVAGPEEAKLFLLKYLHRSETVKDGHPAGKKEYKYLFSQADEVIDLVALHAKVQELNANEIEDENIQRAHALFMEGYEEYMKTGSQAGDDEDYSLTVE